MGSKETTLLLATFLCKIRRIYNSLVGKVKKINLKLSKNKYEGAVLGLLWLKKNQTDIHIEGIYCLLIQRFKLVGVQSDPGAQRMPSGLFLFSFPLLA